MRLATLRRPSLLASAAVAAVAGLALATSAFADGPTTDDVRAQPFLKFVDFNHPEACTVGGLTGTPIHPSKFTYTGGDNQRHLNITALPADVTVTGMVVRAGDVFNVYLAGKLGDTLPWNELRAPSVDGGETLPEIGEWFGCGIVKEQPPSSSVTTPPSTTTETSTVTHSSTPTSTATSAPESSAEIVSTTTTTTVAAVQGAQVNDLAATGFGSAWLLGLGAALVAAGAAVMLVVRRRRV